MTENKDPLAENKTLEFLISDTLKLKKNINERIDKINERINKGSIGGVKLQEKLEW